MKRSIGPAMLVIALIGFATLAEAQTVSGAASLHRHQSGHSRRFAEQRIRRRHEQRMGDRGFLRCTGDADRACLCLARRRHDRPRHARRAEQRRGLPHQGQPWPDRGSGPRFPGSIR